MSEIKFEACEAGLWMVRPGDEDAPNLICFPCAGGSASMFRAFCKEVHPSWTVRAFEPPGHGFNREPLIDSITGLVDAYWSDVCSLPLEKTFLLGHSMGGLLAYRLAQRLEEQKRSLAGLILAGVNGPRKIIDEAWSGLDDEGLIDCLNRIGGIDPGLLELGDEVRAFLPPVRADFRALEDYVHPPLPAIGISTLLLASRHDPMVRVPRTLEWSQSCARIEVRYVQGEHFFFETHPQAIAQEVSTWMGPRLSQLKAQPS